MDYNWIARSLRRAGIVFSIMFLYLLSFGPVARFCTKRSLSETGTPTGLTVIYTVEYPRWVTIVCAPALAVWQISTPEGGLLSFYWEYLHWWMYPPSED